MPYTDEQCRAFGAKAGRGERVPGDWKQYCAKSDNPGHYVSKRTKEAHDVKNAMRRRKAY